jgi:hypothetical protein
MLPKNILIRVYMTKIIIREKRVQGAWLSGSKSRCSISRMEKVLLFDEKRRKHSKIGAIFKRIWKVVKLVMAFTVSLATILKFVSFVKNLPIW